MRRSRNDAAQHGLDRRMQGSQPSYPQDNLHQWAYDESLNFEQFSDGGSNPNLSQPPVNESSLSSSSGLPDDISELLAMLPSLESGGSDFHSPLHSASQMSSSGSGLQFSPNGSSVGPSSDPGASWQQQARRPTFPMAPRDSSAAENDADSSSFAGLPGRTVPTGSRPLQDSASAGLSSSMRGLDASYDAANGLWYVPGATSMPGISPSLSAELAALQLQSNVNDASSRSWTAASALHGHGLQEQHFASSSHHLTTSQATMHPSADVAMSGLDVSAQALGPPFVQDDSAGQFSFGTNTSSFDSSARMDDSLLSLRGSSRWLHGRDTPLSSPAASAYLPLSADSAASPLYEDMSRPQQSIDEFGQAISRGASDDWANTWPRVQHGQHLQAASAASSVGATGHSDGSSRPPSSGSRPRRGTDASQSGSVAGSSRRPRSVNFGRANEGLSPLAERRLSQTSTGRRVGTSPTAVFTPPARPVAVAPSSESLDMYRRQLAQQKPQGPSAPSGMPAPRPQRRQRSATTHKYDEVSDALNTLRQFLSQNLNQKGSREQEQSSERPAHVAVGHSRSASALGPASGGSSHRRLRHVHGQLPPRGSIYNSDFSPPAPTQAAQSLSSSPQHSRDSAGTALQQDVVERIRQLLVQTEDARRRDES